METMTVRQAYLAMYFFMEKLYKMTNSDDMGGFLGGMSLLNDGLPADAAVWSDWMEAVNKATTSTDDDIRLKLV